MNIGESSSETSCKRQENGDASTESERPLKKARFAWQVKGKYHLKNEKSDSSKPSAPSTTDPERAGSSSGSGSSSSDMGTEQNLEILGDYLLKQDFNTLDSVITETDKSLLKPSTSVSCEKLNYPRYVSSYDNIPNNVLNRSSDSSECLSPISMVNIHNYTEDQCIARWQARQIAKGFVDNTINRVLDSWIHVPLPVEEDNSRFLALDVAEFINNLPGDNSIENEGILMAISAHGLQNTSNSSSNNVSHNTEEPSISSNCPPSPLRSRSSSSSDDESREPSNDNCEQSDTDDVTSNDLNMSWTYSEEQKTDQDLASYSLFPETSLSYQYFSGNSLRNDNVECSGDDAIDNHCDFLDTAVLFAIQNKGLTTFGTDYG